MDQQPEMDEHPEQQPAPTVLPVFEGESVSEIEGKLPAVVMAMDEGYSRGTVLRLQVEVHVRNVRHEENRDGELVRQHVFALDGVQLVAAYRPAEARDDVGGSASATPAQTPAGAEELGLEIGRTGQLWGQAS
jgi:hypothetical protein